MVRFPILCLMATMLLAACNQTAYVRDGGQPVTTGGQATKAKSTGQEAANRQDTEAIDPLSNALSGGNRRVSYGLDKDLFHLAPRCVMVLPMDRQQVSSKVARAIEDSVARHLSYRFRRVISAPDVASRQRQSAIRPSDLKRLGRSLHCATAMDIRSGGFEQTYALVWAHARLPLALQLRRAADGQALWWGRHAAERSEGGLPLGVLSLPIEAFSAGRFAGDADVLPSMADDAARRVLESLPALPTG